MSKQTGKGDNPMTEPQAVPSTPTAREVAEAMCCAASHVHTGGWRGCDDPVEKAATLLERFVVNEARAQAQQDTKQGGTDA